ncbi:MAG: threonine ammonia-lyase [Candidatus Dormibacteria bacterium]
MSVDCDAITEAHARILPYIVHTPLLPGGALAEQCHTHLTFKAEYRQHTGSFKLRGALNAALQHPTALGFVAVSSGNHGAAVAYAARLLNRPAVVVMPADSNPEKVALVASFGARIVSDGVTIANREDIVLDVQQATGFTLIHPFNDEAVIAGQGTLGIEILRDGPPPDVILVAVGGGGLISGVATAVKELHPQTRIIGVEPSVADDATRSFAHRTLVTLAEPPSTVADAVRTMHLGSRTFPILLAKVDDMVTATEEEILHAHAVLLTHLGETVEPTAALAFAPLLSGALKVPKSACVILCGGNWSPPGK